MTDPNHSQSRSRSRIDEVKYLGNGPINEDASEDEKFVLPKDD